MTRKAKASSLDWIKDFFTEANPNPGRVGCPEESTLKALAEKRLPVAHPARLHLASCSECFAEFRGYKGDWEQNRKKRLEIFGLAVAACLLVMSGIGLQQYPHRRSDHSSVPIASSQIATADVDLFDVGTSRGGDQDVNDADTVSLPAAIVRLSVTLPRFSEIGQYTVFVSEDRSAAEAIARDSSKTVRRGDKVAVNVTLDLRNVKPGRYLLATVKGTDNAPYYYSIQILSGAR